MHEYQTGIVHIGYGAFHRAHQAMYIDKYMHKTGDHRWGIVAVNLRNEGFREIDDYVVKTPTSYTFVRSHLDYIDWTKNRTIAKHMLTLPSVHLVTITVTESGYAPGSPLFEYLACGLRNRKTPLTILSCDNIRQNGVVLEAQFLAYLYQTNQHELADWVKGSVTFPSCMVDRITPRSTPLLCATVDSLFPGYGQTAVHCEDYTQWVIESKFASDFPDLREVGVIFTDNLEPYEETKIRILNGGHTALAYMGVLSGYETFDQVMADPTLHEHFMRLQLDEIVPSIDIELPFDILTYVKTVEKRLSSPFNRDNLERICMDGFTKFHTFIVPSLKKCLEQGKQPVHMYMSIAGWYTYMRIFAEGTSNIHYDEPNWQLLEPLIHDEDAFLSSERLWGDLPSSFKNDMKYIMLNGGNKLPT